MRLSNGIKIALVAFHGILFPIAGKVVEFVVVEHCEPTSSPTTSFVEKGSPVPDTPSPSPSPSPGIPAQPISETASPTSSVTYWYTTDETMGYTNYPTSSMTYWVTTSETEGYTTAPTGTEHEQGGPSMQTSSPTTSMTSAPTERGLPSCTDGYVYCPGISTCFMDGTFNDDVLPVGDNPWGWTMNYKDCDGLQQECVIYTHVKGCDLTTGTQVGTAQVGHDTFTFSLYEGKYVSNSYHLYAGKCMGNDAGDHLSNPDATCNVQEVAQFTRDVNTFPLIVSGDAYQSGCTLDASTEEKYNAATSWPSDYKVFPLGIQEKDYVVGHLYVCPDTSTPSTPALSPTFNEEGFPSVNTEFPVGPTSFPIMPPTGSPISSPTGRPIATTMAPSKAPTPVPTSTPSATPIISPTFVPTMIPSSKPIISPTFVPTTTPSSKPIISPTVVPTMTPSSKPITSPTFVPIVTPSSKPIISPTFEPTTTPSSKPIISPTFVPTLTPSSKPIKSPTFAPTITPSSKPIISPTFVPTMTPSSKPIIIPTSFMPTMTPSSKPIIPTSSPTGIPIEAPTSKPVVPPTSEPSEAPTFLIYIDYPTDSPSSEPTAQGTYGGQGGPEGCQIGFVYCPGRSTCFTGINGIKPHDDSMWGWSIRYNASEGVVLDCDIYIGAGGGCQLDTATKVGTVTISKHLVHYSLDLGNYVSNSFQLYSGHCPANDGGQQMIDSDTCSDELMSTFADQTDTYTVVYNPDTYQDTYAFDEMSPCSDMWKSVSDTCNPFPLGLGNDIYMSASVDVCAISLQPSAPPTAAPILRKPTVPTSPTQASKPVVQSVPTAPKVPTSAKIPSATSPMAKPLTPSTPKTPTKVPTNAFIPEGKPGGPCQEAYVYCPGRSVSFQDASFNGGVSAVPDSNGNACGWSIKYDFCDGIVDDCIILTDLDDSCDPDSGTKIGSFYFGNDFLHYCIPNVKYVGASFQAYAGTCEANDNGAQITDGGVCDSDVVASYALDYSSFPLIQNNEYTRSFTFDQNYVLPVGQNNPWEGKQIFPMDVGTKYITAFACVVAAV